jgi:hypothetical protein
VTSDSHSTSDSVPPSGDDLGPVPRDYLPRTELEQRQAQFRDRLQRRVARRQRAQQDKQGLLFGLGMFGIVGWSVAIPTLLGIALGQDLRTEHGFSRLHDPPGCRHPPYQGGQGGS